jgi:hypothetical protein
VEFYVDNAKVGEAVDSPYSFVWNTPPLGRHVLQAVGTDDQGASGWSLPVTITVYDSNSAAPFIVGQIPTVGASLTNLTSIAVTFSEEVIGVNASDLLLNGLAATNLTASGSNYTFYFKQPAYGAVTVRWAADHGITDIGWPSDLPFDAQGPGATWSYTLLDPTPPVILAKNPSAGATLTNLAQVMVIFSESVKGVDATDLLVNGIAATGRTGSGQLYTFTFPQPAGGWVNITWAAGHGITDLSGNPFNAAGTGAAWSYNLIDLNPRLNVSANQSVITISWPTNADGFVLQSADTLTNWQGITNGISNAGVLRLYQWTAAATNTPRLFFRLQK